MKIPALTDAEAQGGDTAEGGFKFQDHLIVARIPIWLAQDGFREMIREGMADAEARFFVPGDSGTCEFVEYKNHRITQSIFWSEIARFQEMEMGTPGTYQKFILVCDSLSQDLHSMLNALRRVRDAFPFYDDAKTIQDASYQAYVKKVIALGQGENTADFIFRKVYIEDNAPDAENLALEVFKTSLLECYPKLENENSKNLRLSHLALVELVSSRKNKPILRHEIEKAIWDTIDPSFHPEPCIRLHTVSDPVETDREQGKISFDWSDFSGGNNRSYPPLEQWSVLVEELQRTKEWILLTERSKHLALTGYRRLSASVAIGSVFSAVAGFSIDLHYRDDIWSTNAFPTEETPHYPWQVNLKQNSSSRELVVAVGVKRNPVSEVTSFLDSEGYNQTSQLFLFSDDAILSPNHANKAVELSKGIIHDALSNVKAEKIHLFLAVPAHFALFLGHRLNATCSVQCYERISVGCYTPTCYLQLT